MFNSINKIRLLAAFFLSSSLLINGSLHANQPGSGGIPTKQNPAKACSDPNSLECSRMEPTEAGMANTKGVVQKKEVDRLTGQYREDLNDSSEINEGPRLPVACTGPDGRTIASGDAAPYFFFAKSTNCARDSETRVCLDGQLSGSASFVACQPFKNCTGPGYTVNHGDSALFSNASTSANCQTQSRTCNDGTLSGSAALTVPGTCTSFSNCTHQGVSIPHGGSRTFYRVTESNNCSAEDTIISCSNGVVSGANQSYAFTTCTTPPPAATCASQRLGWNVAGAACSAQASARSTGQSVSIDSDTANAGRATFSCTNGSWQLQPGATCTAPPPPPANGCTTQNLSWTVGTASCTGTAAAASNGLNRTIFSTNSNSGSSTFQCSNGTWVRQAGATCTAPTATECPAGSKTWTSASGHSCTASHGTASAGGEITLKTTTPNSGSAKYTCNSNGTWSAPSQASCSPPSTPNDADPLACNYTGGPVVINSGDMRTDIVNSGGKVKVTYGTASNGTRGDYWTTGQYPRTLSLNIPDVSRLTRAVLAYREWDDQFFMSVNGQTILAHGNTGFFRDSPQPTMVYDGGRPLKPTIQFQNRSYFLPGKLTGGFNGVPVFEFYSAANPNLSRVGMEFFTGYKSSTPIDIRPFLRNGNNDIQFTTYVWGGGEGYYELEFDLACQGAAPNPAVLPAPRFQNVCIDKTVGWAQETTFQGPDGPEQVRNECVYTINGSFANGLKSWIQFDTPRTTNLPGCKDPFGNSCQYTMRSGNATFQCVDGSWSLDTSQPVACGGGTSPSNPNDNGG